MNKEREYNHIIKKASKITGQIDKIFRTTTAHNAAVVAEIIKTFIDEVVEIRGIPKLTQQSIQDMKRLIKEDLEEQQNGL